MINALRELKDDPFLACDVITGLPGEGEEEFEITRSFLERHGFAMMHVFPFSPRPDTALEHARDKVPEIVRDERAKVLRDLSAQLNQRYVQRQVGKENEMIIEGRRLGHWYGLTGNYMKVTLASDNPNLDVGDLVRIKLLSPETADKAL